MSEEYGLIHDAVRLDPEQVWDRLARYLCASASGPSSDAESFERSDLIEDLMFWHADAFIARLETLYRDCPAIAMDITTAHVGGLAVTDGLERFYALQDAIQGDLEAQGKLARWKGWVPLAPGTSSEPTSE